MQFNNEPAPLTLRANRAAHSIADALRRRLAAARRSHARRALRARMRSIVEEGHPLRDAGRAGRDGSSSRTRRRSSWRCWPGEPGTARARHLRVARRQGDGARGAVRPGGRSSPATSATGAWRCSDARSTDERGQRPPRPGRPADAAALPAGTFDCVLVDAPCSGLGTLRRDPDIRWRRREGDLEPLAASQRRMLQHAAEAVAPGGRLVYATCSSEPEENEAVADGLPRRIPRDSRSVDAQHVSSAPAAFGRRRARAFPHEPCGARPRGVLRRRVHAAAVALVTVPCRLLCVG